MNKPRPFNGPSTVPGHKSGDRRGSNPPAKPQVPKVDTPSLTQQKEKP